MAFRLDSPGPSCRLGTDNLPPQIAVKWKLGTVAVASSMPCPEVPGPSSASSQPSSALSSRLCWGISGCVSDDPLRLK